MMMKPIWTRKDYEEALQRLEEVFDKRAGTIENDEAKTLVKLIDWYQSTNCLIDAANPIESIRVTALRRAMNQAVKSGIANEFNPEVHLANLKLTRLDD